MWVRMSRMRIDESFDEEESGESSFWMSAVGVKTVKRVFAAVRVVPGAEASGESDFLGDGATESEGNAEGVSGSRLESMERRAGSNGGGGERGKAVGDVELGIIARGRLLVRGLSLVGADS